MIKSRSRTEAPVPPARGTDIVAPKPGMAPETLRAALAVEAADAGSFECDLPESKDPGQAAPGMCCSRSLAHGPPAATRLRPVSSTRATVTCGRRSCGSPQPRTTAPCGAAVGPG